MPRVTLSAEGRRELEQDLQQLEAERPTIAEQIRQAREQGRTPPRTSTCATRSTA